MSWPAVALGEVTDINPRGPGRGELAPSVEVDFVPMASVSEGGEMTVSERRTYEEVSKGFTAFRPSDVLLAKITPCFENNKIAKSKVSTKYAFGSTEFHVLRGKPEALDPDYLTYFLRQDHIRKAGERRMTGSGGQRRVPKTFLEELKIPLPPLEEQKRIAGILDQAAELCRLRTHALDKLNTLGQAIFYEMFGSGSFKRVALAEVIEARSSLADPTLPKNAQLPHVGPEHIRQGGAEIEWDRVVSCAQDGVTSGKYRFEPNDIIYSKIRPYLNKVAITDRVGMCSADMYALVANSDVVKNSYLHFILGSSDFLSYAASVSGRANIPKMNRKQLMAYEIPVAPLDMQAEFEGKISSIRGQAAKLSKSLSTGEKLFASLQHRAFRGEL